MYQYLCNRGDEFSISTHIFLSKYTRLNLLNTIYVYLETESQIDKQTGLTASPCGHRPHNWWCYNGGNRGDSGGNRGDADMSPLLTPRPRYQIFSSQISSSVYHRSTIFSRIGKASKVNVMCTETFFYSNGLCSNRNSNILVKARCSHIRKIFIKIIHLKHIYAKTTFPNTTQDSFYSQYMYQLCHHDIRCCRCIWPFVGNRRDIFTLCLVFTRGQFWPSGIVIACVCVCVCPCVCVCVCQSVRQSLACPSDNSGPVQARIAKFGPKV